jgi:hypothetical protein
MNNIEQLIVIVITSYRQKSALKEMTGKKLK